MMKKIGMKKFVAPLALCLAASTPFLYQYVKENFFLKHKDKKISEGLKQLKSEKVDERQKGLLDLLNHIHDEPKEKSGSDYNECSDILYDVGCVKILIGILKTEKNQNDSVIINTLRLLRVLLKSETIEQPKKRTYYISLNIIPLICKVIFTPEHLGVSKSTSDLENFKYSRLDLILLHGLKLLRSLTMFARYTRQLVEEIPHGSHGCLAMVDMFHTHEKKFSYIEKIIALLGHSDAKISSNALGVLSHMSECPEGAKIIGHEFSGCFSKILEIMTTTLDVDSKKMGLIAISNIFHSDPKKYLEKFNVQDTVLHLLRGYDDRSHSKIKDSIIILLCDIVNAMKTYNKESERDEIAKIFISRRINSIMLFQLVEHRRLLVRTNCKKLISILVSDPEKKKNFFSKVHLEDLKKLAKDSKLVSLKKKQASKQKMQQMEQMYAMQAMQQMGGMGPGGGGMGMTPPGMGLMPPGGMGMPMHQH